MSRYQIAIRIKKSTYYSGGLLEDEIYYDEHQAMLGMKALAQAIGKVMQIQLLDADSYEIKEFSNRIELYIYNKNKEKINECELFLVSLVERELDHSPDHVEPTKEGTNKYTIEVTREELEFLYQRCSKKMTRLEESHLDDTPCYRIALQLIHKFQAVKEGEEVHEGRD